jgi:integrase
MLRAGISLPALMRLMGHADIQTTLLYYLPWGVM